MKSSRKKKKLHEGQKEAANGQKKLQNGQKKKLQDVDMSKMHIPPHVLHTENQKAGDIMKRRYSAKIAPSQAPKFARFPSDFDASKAIAQAAHGITPRDTDGQQLYIDPEVFTEPLFNAELYITKTLSNATEADIKEFYSNLVRLRESVSGDLQNNVQSNYSAFVRISKAIRSVESDMGKLRQLVDEFTRLVLDFKGDSGAVPEDHPIGFSSGQRRGAQHRNSVSDLAVIYASHLQALWARVEGSQRYLPVAPGRHVILQVGGWIELHPATWKPSNSASFVLLNDHLLIAVKHRKGPSGRGKRDQESRYVASHCWPLAEIDMAEIDMAEFEKTEENAQIVLHDAIEVRRGRDSWLFELAENGKVKDKMTLLEAFKKAKYQDNQSRKIDSNGSHNLESRQSMSAQQNPTQFAKYLSDNLRRGDLSAMDISSHSSPATSKELRNLQDRMDELDVYIAHRDRERAVKAIERARTVLASLKQDGSIANPTTMKIEERALQLSYILSMDLAANSEKSAFVKKHVSWLARLGFKDLAQSTFLDARTKVIYKRAQQPQFEGDLYDYVVNVSIVYFRLIQNTFTVYSAAFGLDQPSSEFVSWSGDRVKDLRQFLDRQFLGLDKTSQVYNESMQGAVDQCKMLRDIGIDLEFILYEGLSNGSN